MTQAAGRSERSILYALTAADFRRLGMDEVAYIRAQNVQGKDVFVLYAADGTALAVQDSADAAEYSARHHDLGIVTVH